MVKRKKRRVIDYRWYILGPPLGKKKEKKQN
jgi:hypothetical protein